MQAVCESLMQFIDKYQDVLQFAVDCFSVCSFSYGWYVYISHQFSKKTVSLQNGKYHFIVKRKHYNSTDLTTIVSNLYYNGEIIPGELRQEIFRITGTIGTEIKDNE